MGCDADNGAMPERPGEGVLVPATITFRKRQFAGHTDGTIAFFDDDRPDHGLVRCFVLLKENAILAREPWMGESWRDCWYVDLVTIDVDADTIEAEDRYVDLIVGRTGPTFKVIDLDDLAQAVDAGAITAPQAADTLRDLQRFLDAHFSAIGGLSAGGDSIAHSETRLN
jgi:hypothetical protein